MNALLTRLSRLAQRYPDWEIGMNLFFVKGKWRLGTIRHGGSGQISIPVSHLSRGRFHTHPHWSVDPSYTDFKYVDEQVEIDVIGSNNKIAYTHLSLSQRKGAKTRANFEKYICSFEVLDIENAKK